MANIDERELFRIVEGKMDVIDYSVIGSKNEFILAHKDEIIEVMEHLIGQLKEEKWPFNRVE